MSGRACLVLLSLWSASARADLFSPGELSKAHSSLEGLSQCTRCHPAGGQLSQQSCLSCHDEVQAKVNQGKGLHGRISEEKRACEACHHEHQGANAAIVEWGPGGEKGFNHARTGWALKGAHAEVKCRSCHEQRLIVWPAAQRLLAARPETYLGVGTECEGCHFDEHRGQSEAQCSYCHVEKGWKPAPGFRHDADDTSYPLKGKHKAVKCSGCHDAEKDPEPHGFPAPKAETFLRFAPVEHRACTDCHKDPHEGRFGARCQSCHTVEGWSIVRNATAEREFHEKTRFPLKGAHLDVDCAACHGPFKGIKAKFKGLPFQTCGACHADAHVGQFTPATRGGKAPDCDACHTDASFGAPKYGVSEHQQTRYPLEAAHQAVPCAACHPATPALQAKVPKAVVADLTRRKRPLHFSLALFDSGKPLERCDSCHADVHDGQFKGQACDSCHQLASFKKLSFDHQRDSKFPLQGAHLEVACGDCHGPAGGKGPARYKPLERSCRGCHLDVHAGQFSSRGEDARCERCHGSEKWRTLRFVHQPPFTEFVLDGQHARAKCEACHKPVAVARGVTAAQYRPLPTTCEGCHADFHKGAFRGFEP